MEFSDEMKEKMRNRLCKIISKKFETATIFPLSEFENMFGDLWGHFKNQDQLTEQEKTYKEKWLRCREQILNFCHRQKRGAMDELSMYDVIWNRYQTEFIVKKD